MSFVDNSSSFHLADGNINDGYYLNNRVHLTYKGTNKLSSNLQLKLKQGHKSVCGTRRQTRHSQKLPDPVHSSSSDTNDHMDLDASHVFWSTSRAKSSKTHNHPTNKSDKIPQNNNNNSRMSESSRTNMRCVNYYKQNHTTKTCRHKEPIKCAVILDINQTS